MLVITFLKRRAPTGPHSAFSGHFLFGSDPLDFLHLPGIRSHPAPALHDQQDWGGRDHYNSLSVLPGSVPGSLPG